MIGRINKLLLILATIALALYVVVLNQEMVTLRLGRSSAISVNGGVLFIAIFCTGVLAAALVAAFFGIRTYFRERRYRSLERKRQQFYEGLLRARGLLAAGEWNEAKSAWESIIKKDPTDVIARVELSRCLEGSGDTKEALRIIDAARAKAPNNLEVLFRAAELNLALGNKTAAIDNLALVLYQHPNRKASELARKLSEELGRIEDAFEYQRQSERLGANGFAGEQNNLRLEFKQIVAEPGSIEKLRVFVKRHAELTPALNTLSAEEARLGNYDVAAGLLARAGRVENSPAYLQKAAELWITNGMPEKAISALKTAAREAKPGESKILAELSLVRTYLRLQMFSEAEKALAELASLELNSDHQREVLILKGYCLSSMGRHHECGPLWTKLRDQDYKLTEADFDSVLGPISEAPAARLSTP